MSGHNVVSAVTGPKCPKMTDAILNIYKRNKKQTLSRTGEDCAPTSNWGHRNVHVQVHRISIYLAYIDATHGSRHIKGQLSLSDYIHVDCRASSYTVNLKKYVCI